MASTVAASSSARAASSRAKRRFQVGQRLCRAGASRDPPRFSSRWARRRGPVRAQATPGWASTQAMATCAGVLPSERARVARCAAMRRPEARRALWKRGSKWRMSPCSKVVLGPMVPVSRPRPVTLKPMAAGPASAAERQQGAARVPGHGAQLHQDGEGLAHLRGSGPPGGRAGGPPRSGGSARSARRPSRAATVSSTGVAGSSKCTCSRSMRSVPRRCRLRRQAARDRLGGQAWAALPRASPPWWPGAPRRGRAAPPRPAPPRRRRSCPQCRRR